jgi:hypothetical protein
MPSHGHSINDPGHAHGNVPLRTGADPDRGTASSLYSVDNDGTTNTQGTGITINNTGGDTGHDHTISSDGAHTHTVTPPYLASNFIIKT